MRALSVLQAVHKLPDMLACFAFACKGCVSANTPMKLHFADGVAGIAAGLHLQGKKMHFAVACLLAMLLDIYKFPVDEVCLNDVLGHFNHEGHILVVSC